MCYSSSDEVGVKYMKRSYKDEVYSYPFLGLSLVI